MFFFSYFNKFYLFLWFTNADSLNAVPENPQEKISNLCSYVTLMNAKLDAHDMYYMSDLNCCTSANITELKDLEKKQSNQASCIDFIES